MSTLMIVGTMILDVARHKNDGGWSINWTIAGPIIVGVAGIAGTFFAPAWNERRTRRERDVEEFRIARRLVMVELARLNNHVRTAVHSEADVMRAISQVGTFGTPEWDAHRLVLARTLDYDVWLKVAQAYHYFGLASVRFSAFDNTEWSAEDREGLEHISDELNSGVVALGEASRGTNLGPL
jgi:hypothetical protein